MKKNPSNKKLKELSETFLNHIVLDVVENVSYSLNYDDGEREAKRRIVNIAEFLLRATKGGL